MRVWQSECQRSVFSYLICILSWIQAGSGGLLVCGFRHQDAAVVQLPTLMVVPNCCLFLRRLPLHVRDSQPTHEAWAQPTHLDLNMLDIDGLGGDLTLTDHWSRRNLL